MIENNLGNALRTLGERERNSHQLCDAVEALISAWRVMAKVPSYGSTALAGTKKDVAILTERFT